MISNIKALWRAVILQAIMDACNNCKRSEYQLEKKSTIMAIKYG